MICQRYSIYVNDTFLFMGIQDLLQLSTLNPIYIDIDIHQINICIDSGYYQ